MELANKAQFSLEPAASVDLNGTGDRYTTPDAWAVTLGPLAQLTYKRADVKVKAVLSATGSGAGTIELRAGAETLKSFSIDNSQAVQHFAAKLPVSTLTGDAEIVAVVNMTTLAAATMTLDAAVEVETPLVIGSC